MSRATAASRSETGSSVRGRTSESSRMNSRLESESRRAMSRSSSSRRARSASWRNASTLMHWPPPPRSTKRTPSIPPPLSPPRYRRPGGEENVIGCATQWNVSGAPSFSAPARGPHPAARSRPATAASATVVAVTTRRAPASLTVGPRPEPGSEAVAPGHADVGEDGEPRLLTGLDPDVPCAVLGPEVVVAEDIGVVREIDDLERGAEVAPAHGPLPGHPHVEAQVVREPLP